ncbi:MAG TPA: hypothetical protein VF527_08240, partial [Pyrinomonadaceae bacterium]
GVAQERKVLYHNSKPPSARLKEIAEALSSDTKRARILFDQLPGASGYFVRLTQRKHVLDGNSVPDTAVLHIRPYVFITTPESLYGRPLLEILEEIGYEAESILGQQLGLDTVAVVFRYPERITVSEVRDGRLPALWDDKVYVPTWENVFELFRLLARRDAEAGSAAPASCYLTDEERSFVIGFPEEGKRRVRSVPYGGLKAAGGADWVYRRLLENKLSVFEHFRGNGRTQNEIVDQDGTQPERGLLEYVGPNMKIKDLAEVAIIDLGRLTAKVEYKH